MEHRKFLWLWLTFCFISIILVQTVTQKKPYCAYAVHNAIYQTHNLWRRKKQVHIWSNKHIYITNIHQLKNCSICNLTWIVYLSRLGFRTYKVQRRWVGLFSLMITVKIISCYWSIYAVSNKSSRLKLNINIIFSWKILQQVTETTLQTEHVCCFPTSDTFSNLMRHSMYQSKETFINKYFDSVIRENQI